MSVRLKIETKVFLSFCFQYTKPANIYLFKGNNRNTNKRCEIYSQLTMKTPERSHLLSLSLTLNTIQIFFLVFLLLTLNRLEFSILLWYSTAQEIKFSIKDFFSKCDHLMKIYCVDLVTFTEEIFNVKSCAVKNHWWLAFNMRKSSWENLSGITIFGITDSNQKDFFLFKLFKDFEFWIVQFVVRFSLKVLTFYNFVRNR